MVFLWAPLPASCHDNMEASGADSNPQWDITSPSCDGLRAKSLTRKSKYAHSAVVAVVNYFAILISLRPYM